MSKDVTKYQRREKSPAVVKYALNLLLSDGMIVGQTMGCSFRNSI